MLGTHDLALFIGSGLLLNITPGPDTLYIVGRSTAQGMRAGAAAALGIGAGTLVHITALALGLAALLAAVPLALGFGEGAELRRPLGIAIVGGLIVSQLLTLYSTPVIYVYLDGFRSWVVRMRNKTAFKLKTT